MKIVVTGASGNVGSALRRHLDFEDAGVDVRTLSSLRDAFRGADVVVHLAWAIKPTNQETNVDGTEHVLAACVKEDVGHLVLASSVAAYGPAQRWTRVDESWELTGIAGNTYSAHKVRLEQMVQRYPLPCTVIRPCGIGQASAAEKIRRWLLSPLLPPGLLPFLPVPLWNDLRLQLVHADDVARAIVEIIRRKALGAFNLAAEPVLTAPMIAERVGAVRVPVPYPVIEKLAGATARLGLQPLTPEWVRMADQAPLVHTTRAHEDLGWWPEHDARDVLREVIAAMGGRA
ncbi:NAD-dependent epimerase/dehydratase family protein [Lentzea californiensis]|uniref:NAD-dependent epimerase/dehydratase family protein n=1 Tax=Lentzea californiensis TaxID=438851 RepID=UPI002166B9E9|nr:NAD-dependent epimerase/dehydratase family protein [Lentzea californiensis]MCR3753168.1 Nucleoside-diphosphate-sugar epimerase [Lentzea californiensis]